MARLRRAKRAPIDVELSDSADTAPPMAPSWTFNGKTTLQPDGFGLTGDALVTPSSWVGPGPHDPFDVLAAIGVAGWALYGWGVEHVYFGDRLDPRPPRPGPDGRPPPPGRLAATCERVELTSPVRSIVAQGLGASTSM